MRKLGIMAVAALLLTACNKLKVPNAIADLSTTQKSEEVVADAPAAASTTLAMAEPKSAPPADQSTREQDPIPVPNSATRLEDKIPSQIIRNASVEFQVDSTDRSHTRIADILKAHNAYFGSDNRVQGGALIEQHMVIRVPAANFDRLLEALMQESIYTDRKNISAEDVTSEFVDAEARLKAKKEVEARYIELLHRAQKVTDVIEVENNLRVIREEIESTQGRLKLMRDQVAYSTIDLTIYQRLSFTPSPEAGIFSRLGQGFISGWRGFESFIVELVSVWPFMIGLGVLIGWLIRRRNIHKI
jgi:hypothetical protein